MAETNPPPRSVRHEIKQTRPFESVAEEATVSLLRTADVVRHLVGRAVEPHGITGQQYNVLRILRGAGAEGLPTLEIGERLVERTPGTTRLVDQLVRRGLVQRMRGDRDRRVVRCFITPSGLALLATLDDLVSAANRSTVGGLAPDDLRALIALLDRVRARATPT